MAFHEVRFPDKIAIGSRGGMGFRTGVTKVESGAESRHQRLEQPVRRYDIAYGINNDLDNLNLARDFYLERRGAVHSFRFKDHSDYSTAANHRSTPSFDDQLLGIGDNADKTFQLKKKYGNDPYGFEWYIRKPVAGSVRVGVDGVEQLSGWTVDTTTGVITFTTAPAVGLAVTAGCEFDIPCRFDEETDELLEHTHRAYQLAEFPSILIVEDVLPVITDDEFPYGGAQEVEIDGDTVIAFSTGFFVNVTANTGGDLAVLPNAEAVFQGGAYGAIANNTGGDLDVVDEQLAAITTIADGEIKEFHVGSFNGFRAWIAVLG